jgi:hypothetical protein
MALAVKGSRLITVNGAVYRWQLRRRPDCYGIPLAFAVELAGTPGSVLVAVIRDVDHPRSLISRSSLIVRPALVAAVIQAALGQGWQPGSPGVPFRLSLASEDLPDEVKTEMVPFSTYYR